MSLKDNAGKSKKLLCGGGRIESVLNKSGIDEIVL